jgi:hypothetical protein
MKSFIILLFSSPLYLKILLKIILKCRKPMLRAAVNKFFNTETNPLSNKIPRDFMSINFFHETVRSLVSGSERGNNYNTKFSTVNSFSAQLQPCRCVGSR